MSTGGKHLSTLSKGKHLSTLCKGKHLSTLYKGKHLSTLCKGFRGRRAVFMLRQVSVEQFAPQPFAIDIRQYNRRAGCGLHTATTAVVFTRPQQL